MESQSIDSNRDFISDLPEGVISLILSRLDRINSRDVVRTSILSKSWRYKWLCTYNLQLCDLDPENITCFPDLMEKMVRYCISHNIRSFHVKCWNMTIMEEIISAVLVPNIENENFTWSYNCGEGFFVPQSILHCKSSKEMHLGFPTLRVRSVHSFPNLRKLKFFWSVILNEDTNTDTLILQFPVLDKLTIEECQWSVKFVEIHAPQLTDFEWRRRYKSSTEPCDFTIKIVGARLATFDVRSPIICNFNLIRTTVVYACLVGVDANWPQVRMLMKQLSAMKHLWLHLHKIEQPSLGLPIPEYQKLERLNIIYELNKSGAVLELLHATPLLKFLGIGSLLPDEYDYDEVRSVPSCLISCLKEIEFTFHGWRETKYGLEKYLLRNGRQLKKVSLRFFSTTKDVVVRQISSFPKASSDLRIVICDE